MKLFKMNKALFYLIQWTWGLSVNIVGFLIYLICKAKGRRSEKFGYSYIIYLPWKSGGLSLGLFIFIRDDDDADWTYNTRIHEYGHTWQCLLLGPFYWFVIGIPSFVWCNLLSGYRIKRQLSYYIFYPEKWANYFGELATELKMNIKK